MHARCLGTSYLTTNTTSLSMCQFICNEGKVSITHHIFAPLIQQKAKCTYFIHCIDQQISSEPEIYSIEFTRLNPDFVPEIDPESWDALIGEVSEVHEETDIAAAESLMSFLEAY